MVEWSGLLLLPHSPSLECKSPVLQALSTRQDSELPGSSATGDKIYAGQNKGPNGRKGADGMTWREGASIYEEYTYITLPVFQVRRLRIRMFDALLRHRVSATAGVQIQHHISSHTRSSCVLYTLVIRQISSGHCLESLRASGIPRKGLCPAISEQRHVMTFSLLTWRQ